MLRIMLLLIVSVRAIVQVGTLKGDILKFDSSDLTIGKLKLMIETELQIPRDMIKIIKESTLLSDDTMKLPSGDVQLSMVIKSLGLSPQEMVWHYVKQGIIIGVKFALKQEATDINVGDDRGKTLLMVAAENGQVELVKLLVDRGANKRKKERYSDMTAMEYAAIKGHLKVLKLLIDRNTERNIKDKLLFLASRHGQNAVVKFLIELGADKDSQDVSTDTPLMAASAKGHGETVKLLIDEGADKDKQDFRGFGHTALILAAQCGQPNVVKLLIDEGADKNKQDKTGNTALISAASLNHLRCVKILIDEGADKDKQDDKGQTALIKAVKLRRSGIVKVLIDAGADKDKKDFDGKTALMHALFNGSGAEVVELLRDQETRADPMQHFWNLLPYFRQRRYNA